MEPRNWDGPSIDSSILKRLNRLDPQLVVTWSPYSLDVFTSRPIEGSGVLDPYTGEYVTGAVKDPAFYLWRKDEYSTHHVFVNTYPRFTNREVLALERDIARFERPQDIMRLFHERDSALRKRRKASHRAEQRDKIEANDSRINDLVLDGKLGRRQGKMFSYKGQSGRSTPGDVEVDAKEDGWELPEN
jgi:hypothetical protein